MTAMRARAQARRAATTRAVIVILAALLAGVAGGLYYGWVIAPVQYVDADPASLHQSFKDDYILMIATAYAGDGDLEAARAGLSGLGLEPSAFTVSAVAERLTAAGLPAPDAERLAALGTALAAAP
ncbi:MAG: hypothetical protein IT317_22820 [Anaerolineales bacterium]|nr:hypothetical protein [Anaerolineales bacterium]